MSAADGTGRGDVSYRVLPFVEDHAEDHVWVGSLPHGPLSRIEGAGLLVLAAVQDLAEETHGPVARGEIVRAVLEIVDPAPADAEDVISGFLEDLVPLGILERVGGAPPVRAGRTT